MRMDYEKEVEVFQEEKLNRYGWKNHNFRYQKNKKYSAHHIVKKGSTLIGVSDGIAWKNNDIKGMANRSGILEAKPKKTTETEFKKHAQQLLSYFRFSEAVWAWISSIRYNMYFFKKNGKIIQVKDLPKHNDFVNGTYVLNRIKRTLKKDTKKDKRIPTDIELKVILDNSILEIWSGGEFNAEERVKIFGCYLLALLYDQDMTKSNHAYDIQPRMLNSLLSAIRRRYNAAIKYLGISFLKGDELDSERLESVLVRLTNLFYKFKLVDLTEVSDIYEKYAGSLLKGDAGQYFTTRNLIDTCVKLLLMMIDHLGLDIVGKDFGDHFGGSAGFNIEMLIEFEKYLNNRGVNLAIKDLAKNCWYSDISSTLCQIAAINMYLHGDGHGNVFNIDCFSERAKKLKALDFFLTNIPFGKDKKHGGRLEKNAFRFLYEKTNDDGICIFICPDSLLNNVYIMQDIYAEISLLFSISLPKETFGLRTGGVQTSIVGFQKKVPDNNHTFYAGKVDSVGYTASGVEIKSDLPELLADVKRMLSGNKSLIFGVLIKQKGLKRYDGKYHYIKKRYDFSSGINILDLVDVIEKKYIFKRKEEVYRYVETGSIEARTFRIHPRDMYYGDNIPPKDIKKIPTRGSLGGKACEKGDLLISRKRNDSERGGISVGIVEEDDLVVTSGLDVLRPKQGVDARMLMIALQTPFIKLQFEMLSRNLTQPEINARLDLPVVRIPIISKEKIEKYFDLERKLKELEEEKFKLISEISVD